jgi:hypothetical protein
MTTPVRLLFDQWKPDTDDHRIAWQAREVLIQGVLGMTNFQLQPQTVGGQGRQFSRIANDVADITTWWESNMSVLGDYCGTDSAGQQFKAALEPKLDSIDQDLPQIVQKLYTLGTLLDRLAQQSTHNDSTSSHAIRTITHHRAQQHSHGRHR